MSTDSLTYSRQRRNNNSLDNNIQGLDNHTIPFIFCPFYKTVLISWLTWNIFTRKGKKNMTIFHSLPKEDIRISMEIQMFYASLIQNLWWLEGAK